MNSWRAATWGVAMAGLLTTLAGISLIFMLWWSAEPDVIDVPRVTLQTAEDAGHQPLTGYATTTALIEVMDTLLEKPGGYLSNDILSPAIFLDNIPNFEFGALVQVRDLSRALRNDWSRSQTQSTEDPDLTIADPQFHFDNNSWILPPSEAEYRKGIKAVARYRERLADPSQIDAQFFSRADNLREWLVVVEKRLGSLSQRLSASVGQVRVNTDLSGEPQAGSATSRPDRMSVKTPWLEIDDVFYEARGATWALLAFLEAAEIDFADVLEDKNARISLKQIIRELRTAQSDMSSPIVLNGSGFGVFANHSLVMASYISRANAAVIDLRNLLEQG